jgi:hypothetical protein
MKERILMAGLMAATVVFLTGALPAQAKGPGEKLDGQVVVGGPGLSDPIVIEGSTIGNEFGLGHDGTAASVAGASDFSTFLTDAGVFGAGPEIGWYELKPKDLAAIGPVYSATITVTSHNPPITIRQDLYPFAPDRPLVHILAGQKGLFGQKMAEWWSGPPELLALLISHGLPAIPPVVPVPAPAPRGIPQPVAPRNWVWVATIAALLAMVVTGAALGRRRSSIEAA